MVKLYDVYLIQNQIFGSLKISLSKVKFYLSMLKYSLFSSMVQTTRKSDSWIKSCCILMLEAKSNMFIPMFVGSDASKLASHIINLAVHWQIRSHGEVWCHKHWWSPCSQWWEWSMMSTSYQHMTQWTWKESSGLQGVHTWIHNALAVKVGWLCPHYYAT